MPTVRWRKHCALSHPVESAMSGMSPSDDLRGRRKRFGSSRSLLVHAVMGTSIRRRHFPTCITIGTSEPAGGSVSVKRPFVSVTLHTIGCPDAAAWHVAHTGPDGIASSGLFGT